MTSRSDIAVCQIHKDNFETLFEPVIEAGLVVFRPAAYATIEASISKVLSACAHHGFLVLLPETAVPISFLGTVRELASDLNLTIIAGLEHDVTWPHWAVERDYWNGSFTVENRIAVVWPDRNREVTFGCKNFPAVMKEHSIVEQIARNPIPEFLLVTVSAPDGRRIKVWPVLCSDFLWLTDERVIDQDELDRAVRDHDIDLIAVLSHTARVDPFHVKMHQLIAGGMRRPLPVNIAFANLASYGGSICLASSERASLRQDTNIAARALARGVESHYLFSNWAR